MVYSFSTKNKAIFYPCFCRGHVLLIVNVASKCGLTSKNYAELVQLDEKLKDKGLRILAFPCNQFGHQVCNILIFRKYSVKLILCKKKELFSRLK